MVSELTVDPNEEFNLEICLKAPNYENVWMVGGSSSLKTLFMYRFSSAAVWNGPIKRGHVEIVPAGIDASGMKVLAPANRYTRRKDGAWVWEFVDWEPTFDDGLCMQVVPDMESDYSTVIGKPEDERWKWSENHVMSYGDRWLRGVDIGDWTMSASHTSSRPIAHYYRDAEVLRPLDVAQLPKRLRYRRHDDVWGTDAPNHGVGQSVTLSFKKPVALGLIQLKTAGKTAPNGRRDTDA